MMSCTNEPLITVIVPVHNGEPWIDDCLLSIQSQTATKLLTIEICVYNDASTDRTAEFLSRWVEKLKIENIMLNVIHNEGPSPRGSGYARNQAVLHSRGTYLCFQDIDDIMMPDRILRQYNVSKTQPNAIVGSQFKRLPEDSTVRYTKWANSLNMIQLYKQIYTSHGPTIILPTWFCKRDIFDRAGGFSEAGQGIPEDLLFLYSHLDKGGDLVKIDECLVVYRYHLNSATFSIHQGTIWDIRIKRIQEVCLIHWDSFTIWNAGKQGRRFYKSLEPIFQEKVMAFCDVDEQKVGKNYQPYDRAHRHAQTRPIPILHFSNAKPPFVICVKLDMTGGIFEENLSSLNLVEGSDYILFS